MRRATERPGFPGVILFGTTDVETSRLFLSDRWPEVRVVCDQEKGFYRALGLGRGSLWELFGVGVWGAGIRSLARGYGIGRPAGDPFQMPGIFLVDGGHITWSHRSRHAGDHPDLAAVPLAPQPRR